MMVRREPVVAPVATESLASKLDKGFPYDDGDNTIEDAAQMYVNKGPKDPSAANFVGKLNGENITKDALVNLVMDTEVPLTQQLIQLESNVHSDGDNVFKLMDENVTKGQMKNLITDKPAPITVKLAQTGGEPILVNPIVAPPTGAEIEPLAQPSHPTGAMRVGRDNVSVADKKQT